MTVHVKSTETDETITLHWESNRAGDVVDNPAGVGSLHPTILTEGKVRLEIDDEPPQEFTAPHTITLPTGTGYSFTTLTPRTTIDCVYDKRSGAADEIQHLNTHDERFTYKR